MLTCSQGTWASDVLGSFLYRAPQSVDYQWQINGSIIAGATGSSHAPSTAGSYSCRVTATNQAGATAQTSSDLYVAQAAKASECEGLRDKRKRQRRGLAAATSGKKHSQIRENIKHTKKRLKTLGCK